MTIFSEWNCIFSEMIISGLVYYTSEQKHCMHAAVDKICMFYLTITDYASSRFRASPSLTITS